jgi:glycosyltransferase involved in cell wall biosynthesis
VIVVDNNCSDNTAIIVEKWQPHMDVKIIKETRQGLSFARNAGMLYSNSSLVAFLDDDCTVSPGWLQAVTNGFREFPDTVCFGGRIDLKWENGVQPSWIPDNVLPVLGFQDFGNQHIEVKHVNGGNMIWVREILLHLGGFNVNLGRIAEKKLSSEESEVEEKAKRAGHIIRYLPKAIAFHWIPVERQSRRHVLELCYMVGRSSSIHDHMNISAGSEVRLFLRSTRSLLATVSQLVISCFQELLKKEQKTLYFLCRTSISLGNWIMNGRFLLFRNK